MVTGGQLHAPTPFHALPQWKYFPAFSVSLVSGSKCHNCYSYRDSKSGHVDKTRKYARSHGGCWSVAGLLHRLRVQSFLRLYDFSIHQDQFDYRHTGGRARLRNVGTFNYFHGIWHLIIFMVYDIWLFSWNMIFDYFHGIWYLIIFMEYDIWLFSWNMTFDYFHGIWHLIIFMEYDIWLFLWNMIFYYFHGIWHLIIFMEYDIWLFSWYMTFDYFHGIWHLIIFMVYDIWLFSWYMTFDYFHGIWHLIIFMVYDIWLFSWYMTFDYFHEIWYLVKARRPATGVVCASTGGAVLYLMYLFVYSVCWRSVSVLCGHFFMSLFSAEPGDVPE